MIRLCHIDDLPEQGGREFEPPGQGAVFLVREGNIVYAYRNRCPHLGISLNWSPDDFLSESGSHIRCTTHGARFRIDDGFCVAGPCKGQSLESVHVRIEAGMIFLESCERGEMV